MSRVDILAIGVHPDDVELSCSGTLLKHIEMGKKVGLLDLTAGELGTRGSAEIRLREAEKARQLMGAAFRINLHMADGFVEHSRENVLKIIEVIRASQPEVVLANAKSDRHPDHGKAAKLASDACFLSGLVKIETRSDGQVQDRWRPKAVYHYIQDHDLEPGFVVDISAHFEAKMRCIMAFQSQFYNPESDEPDSPYIKQILS